MYERGREKERDSVGRREGFGADVGFPLRPFFVFFKGNAGDTGGTKQLDGKGRTVLNHTVSVVGLHFTQHTQPVHQRLTKFDKHTHETDVLNQR